MVWPCSDPQRGRKKLMRGVRATDVLILFAHAGVGAVTVITVSSVITGITTFTVALAITGIDIGIGLITGSPVISAIAGNHAQLWPLRLA